MKIRRSNINLLLVIFVMFGLSSCGIYVSNKLGNEEYLIKKNKIIIDDKAYSKHDVDLIYNLESLILKKPNRDYFFIPREYLYFRNKEEFESGKKKKGWVKNAERPSIHDDESMFASAEQMEKYLRFSKGYYDAKVYPKAYLNDKKAEIHYYVTTAKGYTIRSKEYFSQDSQILKIINSIEDKSFMQENTPVDEGIFDNEKNRVASHLQELGYANFGKNNIDFKADSSNHQMDIFITILPPVNDSLHRRYTIGDIKVYPDYKGIINDSYSNSVFQDSIQFYYNTSNFFVKPSTLGRSIQFRKGDVFRKSNLDNSYSALANLGTFRYINITSSISPLADTIIDYSIQLTPISDPWALEGSADLFYSYFVNGLQRVGVGLAGSVNNANAFGGGEKFRLGAEVLAETQINSQLLQNFSSKIETGLTYPTVIDPLKHVWLARKTGLLGPRLYNKFYNNSTTDMELNYKFESFFGLYLLHSIQGDFLYEYSPESKIKMLYTLININSISTRIDPENPFIEDNKLLERSLEPSLITGFLLQEFEYRVDNPVFANGFSWGANFRIEQSGLEIAALNYFYNAGRQWANLPPQEWSITLNSGNQFRFSKYLLVDLDIHAEQRLYRDHRIAGRLRGGVAKAFGQDAVIPFIKQFYVGGGNSLRGWNTRELGPGAYSETFIKMDSIFYQTGDVALEANIEYRFPIYYVFEGAAFIDAGNVWTLQDDVDRPGSQFFWNEFYNQIALNYGIGVRINLDFIILRFDFGQKMRYPFRHPDTGNYWIRPEFTTDYLFDTNFTFGLNYPF